MSGCRRRLRNHRSILEAVPELHLTDIIRDNDGRSLWDEGLTDFGVNGLNSEWVFVEYHAETHSKTLDGGSFLRWLPVSPPHK